MPKFLEKIKNFFLTMGDGGILAMLCAGIILTGVLLWALTGQPRNNAVIDAVNKCLTERGEVRRVSSLVSTFGLSGKATQMGTWCTLSSGELSVIFPLISGGVFSPCMGIVNNDGTLANIIPLSRNAEIVIQRMQTDMLQIHIKRIEKSAVIIIDSRLGSRSNAASGSR
ncbi:MAG: hypothetical protein Ta2F_07440 [Termitinemataceae bacterium]|nr:MAG: hypothetical protein Ta2F_07440 [Termitinemataceae bacterium]